MTITDAYLLQASLSDGLNLDTLTVIKEPTGTFFVGFPFNLRADSVSSLVDKFKELGFNISKGSIDSLSKMDSYNIEAFKIKDRTIEPTKVQYLYSIPSSSLTL